MNVEDLDQDLVDELGDQKDDQGPALEREKGLFHEKGEHRQ